LSKGNVPVFKLRGPLVQNQACQQL